MSLTLQQLRSRTLDFLRETASDSHFTTDQLNGYLNDAQEYVALVTSPPEDLVTVAVETNKGSYLLPSDNILITSAFYGDSTISNNVRPLTIISKINAKHMFPSWLDETTQTTGEPTHLWYLDNSSIFVYPRPNSEQTGKRILMYYGFSPTLMTADGDVPSVRNNYHSLLPKYACRMAYYALSNPVMAKEMMNAFLQDLSQIKSTVEKEAEENFAFKWSVRE